ncbi:MAG TPA: MBL fold metallo-hydrolase [Rhodospirillaceae bacterium]|nr:MBL fold metallo-hydrolase [Rhodospirillaceae bacterium]
MTFSGAAWPFFVAPFFLSRYISPRMSDRNDTSRVTLRFEGIRGTVAASGIHTMRYGGNTACVFLRCGPHTVILDAGTGIVPLGWRMAAMGTPIDADIILSHFHMDHTCGMPFFAPLFNPENRFRIWGFGHPEGETTRSILSNHFCPPYEPFTPADFLSHPEFHDFHPHDTFELHPGLMVHTLPLNHPNGACGFRIEYAGRKICYLSDTEHTPGAPDARIINFCKDADIFIYDAMFTDAEFPNFIGWGHSTWQEACRLAQACGAKRTALFHLRPARDDDENDLIDRLAGEAAPGTIVAREGLEIEL